MSGKAEGGFPMRPNRSGPDRLGELLDQLHSALGDAALNEALDEATQDKLADARSAVGDAMWGAPVKIGERQQPRSTRAERAMKAATECAAALPRKYAEPVRQAVAAVQEKLEAGDKPLAGQAMPEEQDMPEETAGRGYTTATGRKVFK